MIRELVLKHVGPTSELEFSFAPRLNLLTGDNGLGKTFVLERAVGMIAPNVAIQLFAATHSPLILASLESVFKETLDDLFVFERDGRLVGVQERSFGKEGDVSNWLASEVFGGVGGRSREARLAVDAALDFLHEEDRIRLNEVTHAEASASSDNATKVKKRKTFDAR